MNAFIVEDHDGIREILVTMLEKRGHVVSAFGSAETALPELRNGSFELGILDWGLPGIDGLELCRQYRAEFPGATTNIIVLTGRAEPDDLDEVVAAGANDYITKPFRLDALETRVAFAERSVSTEPSHVPVSIWAAEPETRYKRLIESIPLITYVESNDSAQTITYISPQIEDLMGWTPEEVMASPGFWREILHPDDRERAFAAELSSEFGANRFSSEYRQRCRNGEYRWFRDEAEPFLDESGTILSWHGAIQDVTAQKELELALMQQERDHRALSLSAERKANELRLLDLVGSAIANELELQGVFRIVVDATAEILGYPFTSIYLRDRDSLHLQCHTGYADEAAIIHVVQEGQGISGTVGFNGESRLIADTQHHPDFLSASDQVSYEICVPLFDRQVVVGVFNIETTIDQPLTDDDLRLLEGVAKLVNSAISRARLFAQAKESERRLRSVLEEVRDVVFQLDGHGRWTFLNPAWEEISGYTIAESLGREVAEFSDAEGRVAINETMEELRSGRLWEVRGDFRLLTASGGRLWLETHATRTGEGARFSISGTLTDITERKVAEAALAESQESYRHLALHDPLTSLPNRSLFMERLEEGLRACAETAGAMSVLFLDLDGFKQVNDTMGHDAGDALLTQVASRLSGVLREGDTVARLGGDEFALLIHDNASFSVADEVSQRILDSFRVPFSLLNQEVSLGSSVGVAGHQGANGKANHLLRNADTALYVSKASGRGLFTRYQPRMSAAVLARYQQEQQLRSGIDEEQVNLLYTPVFDLQTHHLLSVETSAQWRDPDGRLVPASEFFDLVESTGLSVKLGEIVFRLACRELGEIRKQFDTQELNVVITLSLRELQDSSLVNRMRRTLLEFGVAPGSIELVIMEIGAISDDEQVRSTLHKLRELGVGLALDNVCSSQGTLRALWELPLTGIRIERAFIRDLGRDRAGKEIVRAITALAHTLGMTVTTDGIDMIDQLAHVRAIGIDRGRGSYFGRPLGVPGVMALMKPDGSPQPHPQLISQ